MKGGTKVFVLTNIYTKNDFVRAWMILDKFNKSGRKKGRKNELACNFFDDDGNKLCRFTTYETDIQHFITKEETFREDTY